MKLNIFFDLDSTLVTIEGLDYLASLKGLADQVVPITNAAMNGEIPMQVAMKRKIELLQPSRQDIERIGQVYLNSFTFGAKETVRELHDSGYNCWILTGNFTEAANTVAEVLEIPKHRVIANQIQYNNHGDFLRFDLSVNPLASKGGKTVSLQKLGLDLAKVIMIGDGNTDLETQDYVGLFIGFGGVVKRPHVAEHAKVYVDTPDLRAIIPHTTAWQTTMPQ